MKFGQWLGFLGLVASLYILWQIHQLLLLVLTAVILATALNRLARQFQKLRIGRGLAIALSVIFVFLGLTLFSWIVAPPFFNQFQKVLQLFPTGFLQAQIWVQLLSQQIPPWLPEFPDLQNFIQPLVQQLQPLIAQVAQNFVAIFSNIFNVVLQLLFVLVLTIMLAANPAGYRKVFLLLFPSFYRRRVDEILNKCEIALGDWLSALLIRSVVIGALSALGLWLLGVPLVLAHALVAAVLEVIPNIGPTLSAIPPIAIALLDSPWKALGVLILYLVIQQIESFWLTPAVMAQQASLLPGATLVLQIVFATLFGFLGLLLALPLALIVKVWLEEALIKDILDQWHHHPAYYAANSQVMITPQVSEPNPYSEDRMEDQIEDQIPSDSNR